MRTRKMVAAGMEKGPPGDGPHKPEDGNPKTGMNQANRTGWVENALSAGTAVP